MSDENPYGGKAEPPEEQPPSPYQGAGAAPGSYQPYPGGGYDAPRPRSDRWKIWLGIALTIPVLVVTGFVAAVAGAIDDSGALSGLIGLAGLVGPVVMLFFGSTRKLGLGLLIGYAVLGILLAGACVALLTAYN